MLFASVEVKMSFNSEAGTNRRKSYSEHLSPHLWRRFVVPIRLSAASISQIYENVTLLMSSSRDNTTAIHCHNQLLLNVNLSSLQPLTILLHCFSSEEYERCEIRRVVGNSI